MLVPLVEMVILVFQVLPELKVRLEHQDFLVPALPALLAPLVFPVRMVNQVVLVDLVLKVLKAQLVNPADQEAPALLVSLVDLELRATLVLLDIPDLPEKMDAPVLQALNQDLRALKVLPALLDSTALLAKMDAQVTQVVQAKMASLADPDIPVDPVNLVNLERMVFLVDPVLQVSPVAQALSDLKESPVHLALTVLLVVLAQSAPSVQ